MCLFSSVFLDLHPHETCAQMHQITERLWSLKEYDDQADFFWCRQAAHKPT